MIAGRLWIARNLPGAFRQAVATATVSCAVAFCAGCAASDAVVETKLRAILDTQADAWNRGDIEGFMDPYWHSGQLTFSAEGQTRQGWEATIERYRARYPTPERMGHLRFSVDRVRRLGPEAAFVLGRWALAREPDPIGGNFSLIFQRIAGRWLIVHDHTSAAPAGP